MNNAYGGCVCRSTRSSSSVIRTASRRTMRFGFGDSSRARNVSARDKCLSLARCTFDVSLVVDDALHFLASSVTDPHCLSFPELRSDRFEGLRRLGFLALAHRTKRVE